ncbi:FAD-binding oxidoreductase [Carnimonas nigrificans]|uniref:FAD-binding oxidoreductase n=1 Tax=Carnimonas nigrificans TaxID=64323 RepID=UPI0004B0154A|nr:FAD-binding oxidoreductase [Carnimonas nigrificans]
MTTQDANATALEALQADCANLTWITRPALLKRLSKDFSWFSPVLKEQLSDCVAEIGARPASEGELAQLVSACVKQQIPMTIRGGGSGNYGQAVPLQGGVVIDMTSLNAIKSHGNGSVRAQAGIRLIDLESAVRPTGWELRCMPSTFRMATLGGFYGGGFGGIGSITYGPLATPGTVIGACIMTIEEKPRIIELDAEGASHIAHAYGTNAIILELTLTLAPRVNWCEQLLAFPDQDAAMQFALKVAKLPGLIKREIGYFEPSVVCFFDSWAEQFTETEHALILTTAVQSESTIKGLLNEFQGRAITTQAGVEEKQYEHSLHEYCWNHTTLHALSHDSSLTYLQAMFPIGHELEALKTLRERLGDELLQHIELLRNDKGEVFCAGLTLLRYRDQARLNEVIALHRELGIQINDPHTYILELGKHAAGFDHDILTTKRNYDPQGLLNPGKMKSF